MSDALSDDGHGFWRFCPRDVSALSLVCGPVSVGEMQEEGKVEPIFPRGNEFS